MDDLISRQAVLDAIDDIESEVADGEGYQYEKWRKYFCDLPSAQPERKTGKWINKEGGIATCSVCGDRWGVWSVMNFCPNCGADMKGGD